MPGNLRRKDRHLHLAQEQSRVAWVSQGCRTRMYTILTRGFRLGVPSHASQPSMLRPLSRSEPQFQLPIPPGPQLPANPHSHSPYTYSCRIVTPANAVGVRHFRGSGHPYSQSSGAGHILFSYLHVQHGLWKDSHGALTSLKNQQNTHEKGHTFGLSQNWGQKLSLP